MPEDSQQEETKEKAPEMVLSQESQEAVISEVSVAEEKRSVDDRIQEIFSVICDITGSDIKLEAAADGGKAKPAFDINGAISKIVALSVYCGMNVPASFGPAYNRVHADVEYWKKRFQE